MENEEVVPAQEPLFEIEEAPVSYTHLTLPTIGYV